MKEQLIWVGGRRLEDYPKEHMDFNSASDIKIRLVLDCEHGEALFEKNGKCLDVAFKELPKTKLYPCLSSMYGTSNVTLLYLGNHPSRYSD